jgi:ribonuclease R
VKVKLVEALPVAGALRFEIISEGRYMKPAGGMKKSGRRGDLRAPRSAKGRPAQAKPHRKGR